MKSMPFRKTTVLSIALAALGGSSHLLASGAESCADGSYPVAVKGKILNNGQAGGSFSTLGVVVLRGDDPIGRMKCGIVGIPATPTDPDFPLVFTHTVSCNDQVTLPIPELGYPVVHSQIAFDTQGFFHEDFQFCNGTDSSDGVSSSFTEYSVPRAGEGRGVFTSTTGGQLTINGTISCVGTIDMKFRGEICLAP